MVISSYKGKRLGSSITYPVMAPVFKMYAASIVELDDVLDKNMRIVVQGTELNDVSYQPKLGRDLKSV